MLSWILVTTAEAQLSLPRLSGGSDGVNEMLFEATGSKCSLSPLSPCLQGLDCPGLVSSTDHHWRSSAERKQDFHFPFTGLHPVKSGFRLVHGPMWSSAQIQRLHFCRANEACVSWRRQTRAQPWREEQRRKPRSTPTCWTFYSQHTPIPSGVLGEAMAGPVSASRYLQQDGPSVGGVGQVSKYDGRHLRQEAIKPHHRQQP